MQELRHGVGNKMRCPKCKKEMSGFSSGNVVRDDYSGFYCINKTCWFYGIERISEMSGEEE